MRSISPCIKKSLREAVKAAGQFQDVAKQDLAARSVLLSEFLGEVQSADLDNNPEALERARHLLENMVQAHGTPSRNALIRKLTKNHPRLTLLWGAVHDDGELADLYKLGRKQWQGRVVTTPKESLLSSYYRQLGGVTLESVVERLNHQPEQQWAEAKTLAQLLDDDDVFYHDRLFYPATALYQGRNGYELIAEFESQALVLNPEQEQEQRLIEKLNAQIDLLRKQMKYRPLESIPVNLHAFTKTGWLRLEILNKCPAIMEMGQLYQLPKGKVGIKATPAYANSLEVESLTNHLNRAKLSAGDAEDYETHSHEGVNSAKRKEYIGILVEEVRDWLLTSEFRQEVEWEFNRRFNGFITKTYSDEPFDLLRLEPPTGLAPHPYQYQDIRQLNDMGKGILAWSVGLGKAQPLDAKILTPTGWKLMGEMRVGDLIINSQGGTSKVTGIFPQGSKEVFQVKFSDDSQTECCDDHLWAVTYVTGRRRSRTDGSLFPPKVLPLKELRHNLTTPNGHSRYAIPMVKPIEFPKKRTIIPPYVMGLLLGDGSFRHGIYISTHDEEVVDSVRKILPPGLSLRPADPDHPFDWHITAGDVGGGRNPYFTECKRLGLIRLGAESKFIPDDYKFGSLEDRIELLQGLMDSDGGPYRETNEFSSVSKQLALDTQFVVQSLGGKAKMSNRIPTYTYKGEKLEGQRSYRLNISMPPEINPYRLTRKANLYVPRSKYPPIRIIKKVTSIGEKPCQCISVDAPDHLYVTDDCILTHNTIGALMLILYRQERGLCRTAMVVAPKSLVANWKSEIDRWCPSVRYLVIGLTQKFWADGTPMREVSGYQVVTEEGSPKRVNGNYVLKALIAKDVIEMTAAEFDRRAELQFSEDSPDEKLAKLHQASVNTYDILLCWRETFKSIPLDAATELRYLDDLVGRHLPSDENDNYFGDSKDAVSIADRRKELLEQIEQEKESAEPLDVDTVIAAVKQEIADNEDDRDYHEQEIRAKKRAVLNERRGDKLSTKLMTFNQLLGTGSMLVIDEAHGYRNLFAAQGDHADTKGAKINPSQRAYDLYMKARYILECNDRTNVFLLTATPVANSPIDLCALMMLFADEELRERGIEVIDDFISIFGKVAEITSPSMSGTIQTAETLYGFQLLNELRSLALKYTIRRDGRSVNFKQPQERNLSHVIPLTSEQNYLYALLIARMEYGLSLMAEGSKGWAEFKTSPWLFPFSVLADMDKLSLDPQNYLQGSKYGAKLDDLWAIASDSGRYAYTLNNSINNYNFRLSETLQTLSETTTEARGFPLYHSSRKRRYGEIESTDPDFSDQFYEIFKELKESRAQFAAVGSLGDYTEKHYGDRLEHGCIRTIMGVDYELEITEGLESLFRQWKWVDGYPFHSKEMWHAIRYIVLADREVKSLQAAVSSIEWNIKSTRDDLKLAAADRERVLISLNEDLDAAIKARTAGEAVAQKARQDCQVQPGDLAFHNEVTHVLTANYDWRRDDNLPMYNDSSAKFERLVAEAVMYYHAGCLDVEVLETGQKVKTTPHGLFTLDAEEEKPDIEAAIANWSTLAVGQEHAIWIDGKRHAARILAISPGNQLIFADQVGSESGDRESVRVYKHIKQMLVDAGIPARVIEMIYGAVKPEKRQAIAQRYASGDVRIVILNTATGGEGLNLQGSVYFTVAIHHLTLPWHGAAIKQRQGRGVRQGNEMGWVDTHFYLAPGTIDQFRVFVIKRKTNSDDSLWSEEVDELVNETGIPTFDEMCAALSNDPIEAKRRIEEARVKEEHRKRTQKQDQALSRFFQFFNQLCLIMHNRKYRGWKPGMPEYQSAVKVIRELATVLSRSEEFNYTHCLDWEKYLKGNELPFLVTKTRQVFEVGDYVTDHWERLYQLEAISGIAGNVKLRGILGVSDTEKQLGKDQSNNDLTGIANQEFADGRLSVKCFAPTDKERSQRRSEGVISWSKKNSYQARAIWNWANVSFSKSTLTHAEVMLKRLALANSYPLLSKLLTPVEIQEHRPAILKNLLVNEPALFCWVTDEGASDHRLDIVLVTELTDVDDIALPDDEGFADQLCIFYFLHRGDPGFRYGGKHKWHLIETILPSLHLTESKLQDRGLELAEDRYPTMEEAQAAIDRYFEANADTLYLEVSKLIELLGYGRGLEQDSLYRALQAKKINVSYITGNYRGSHHSTANREPGPSTSGYYIKRVLPPVEPEASAPST